MKYNPAVVAAYFAQQGLPPFVREHLFDSRPEKRKWRFDFAWLEHRVALEVEGGIWIRGGHSRGTGQSNDHSKFNAAATLGWHVLKCEPKHLCMLETVNLIKKMLSYVEGRVEIKKL